MSTVPSTRSFQVLGLSYGTRVVSATFADVSTEGDLLLFENEGDRQRLVAAFARGRWDTFQLQPEEKES